MAKYLYELRSGYLSGYDCYNMRTGGEETTSLWYFEDTAEANHAYREEMKRAKKSWLNQTRSDPLKQPANDQFVCLDKVFVERGEPGAAFENIGKFYWGAEDEACERAGLSPTAWQDMEPGEVMDMVKAETEKGWK